MGVFNFYINIKCSKNDSSLLLSEYQKNSIYCQTFAFNSFTNSGFDAGIEAILDNFLPTNYLIYSFLSKANDDIVISTNGFDHLFDFKIRSEFINFMCNAWEDRLEYLYCNFGTLLIDMKKYHKSRNKLFSKYYRKFKL